MKRMTVIIPPGDKTVLINMENLNSADMMAVLVAAARVVGQKLRPSPDDEDREILQGIVILEHAIAVLERDLDDDLLRRFRAECAARDAGKGRH